MDDCTAKQKSIEKSLKSIAASLERIADNFPMKQEHEATIMPAMETSGGWRCTCGREGTMGLQGFRKHQAAPNADSPKYPWTS